MVAIKIVSALAAAGLAVAAPTGQSLEKRANIDNTILQFALTLEHLENVFYKEALKNYTLSDFKAAGYSQDYYNNLKYIAYDEQVHVQALSQALSAAGQTPNQACTYRFPSIDVYAPPPSHPSIIIPLTTRTSPTFITLSSVLEGVGTSAYLGAAGLITNKQYLTVAGSILAVEALHTSLQREAIGKIPMANPFETPLDPMSVYTLAAAFIVSCPDSNTPLPFTAFPGLTYDGQSCTCEEPDCSTPSVYVKRNEMWGEGWPKWSKHHGKTYSCAPPSAGADVKFTAAKKIPSGSYVTFVNGLTVTSVQGQVSGKDITATIPQGIAGQTYVFVTKSDVETTFDDSQVLFGPSILEVNPAAPALDYSVQK
ncbi:uncharacterized protein LTR77_002102 [Saxophila tyrrhenica]|uniref:Uncharacterized protein n=1 Tax=Saxophila tyrrhenica TaxID=1690608 RepID=A0AAV9PJD9_9PEZI|nr:hypothetical protein LTR77_002102 [Saxophila tyrrhenica]